MPAKSQKQYAFMKAVEGGYIHPTGLTREKAAEFTSGVKPSKLPEYIKKPSFSSIKKRLKK